MASIDAYRSGMMMTADQARNRLLSGWTDVQALMIVADDSRMENLAIRASLIEWRDRIEAKGEDATTEEIEAYDAHRSRMLEEIDLLCAEYIACCTQIGDAGTEAITTAYYELKEIMEPEAFDRMIEHVGIRPLDPALSPTPAEGEVA